jgi:hypothetical protein
MLKQNWMRRSVLLTAAMLLSAAVMDARAAEPEVLTKVPADAYGLVVINNVRTLSSKISNAATRLNIPVPPDLVGYFTRRVGISKGFDANSSAALVLLKPSAERQAEGYFTGPPPAVLLVPTSDAKLMLEPFTPGEADKAGIQQVTIPDTGDKGFAAVVDKWVALAQSKEDLAAYLARTDAFSDKASSQVRHVFDVNDLVVWGNIPKLSNGVDKTIDNFETDLTGMMDLANVTTNQDPVQAALSKQSVGIGFAFLKQFLKDADSTMLTLRLTDSGATAGIVGDFKSGSVIGKFVASQAGKTVNLEGLPAPAGNGLLAAGAVNWDPASMTTIMTAFFDKLLSNETIAKDPRGVELRKQIDINKQMLSQITGMKFVFLDPSAGGKSGLLNGVLLMDVIDPVKFKTMQMDAIKSMLTSPSMDPNFKQNITTVPDAATIKDVKLSRINISLELRDSTPDKPITPQVRNTLEVAKRIMGPDGMTVYFGIIEKRAILIYGSDATTMESAVTAAKENSDNLSSNAAITATRDQVVGDPIAVSYLPLTRWILAAQALINPAGAPATGPASPAIANAPPIVLSAGVTGSMMTAELHLPIATIQGAQEAIQHLTRSMAPPAGGGGGAGGPMLP